MGSSSSSLHDIAEAERKQIQHTVRTAFDAQSVFSTLAVEKIANLCQELTQKGENSFEFTIPQYAGAFEVQCINFKIAVEQYGLHPEFPTIHGQYGTVAKLLDWDIFNHRLILQDEFERWMKEQCTQTAKQIEQEICKRGFKNSKLSVRVICDCTVRIIFSW